MVIWFETHATSLDNEAGLASGWFDVELSPRGREQARELGDRRRNTGIAAVYCSDLRRAFDTAEIAFAGTSTPIVRDRRLRECNYGDLTRQPVATIESQRLAAVERPFPGGESYQAATLRVADWLREIYAMHRDNIVLVVGHRATLYAFEHLCKGVTLREALAAPWQWQPGWKYDVTLS
jgi:broad specificity phosphatase PhoE